MVYEEATENEKLMHAFLDNIDVTMVNTVESMATQ